ncbi:X-box-binding protein 1 isoform X2 [Parasteatoda tepidariorum]|uniref:X-box-binding protein 1 isoform X2 n=1 Tax=Parasteatoda tepidariorum TaxID=114398 RepID=UPI001C723984|nr:X-box-binding protein 1 isoform X2 [Parasteatoda tepidariorum]
MPQLKKLSTSPSNILPKIDLNLNCGSDTKYPPSYFTLLIEDEKSLTSDQESDVSDSVQNRPRKRQRLDHLSQEEKIMRRKLKNRVAAQTARDRKKARMQELEEQVSRLAAEKKILLMKTVESMKRIQTLEQENSELKLRLGVDVNTTQKVKVENIEKELSSSVLEDNRSLEQASLINGTQLKGQDLQILSLWMMQFVYLPVIARVMTFLICYSSVGKILWSLTSLTLTVENSKSCTLRKWWGPHQKAWNPTKN